MELKEETKIMFRCLDALYNQREYCSGFNDKAINRKNIIDLERKLFDHCYNTYKEPWFRVYAYYRLENGEDWATRTEL